MAGQGIIHHVDSDHKFEFHQDDALTAAKHLSPFQKTKFAFLFNAFFDIKKNGIIEQLTLMR